MKRKAIIAEVNQPFDENYPVYIYEWLKYILRFKSAREMKWQRRDAVAAVISMQLYYNCICLLHTFPFFLKLSTGNLYWFNSSKTNLHNINTYTAKLFAETLLNFKPYKRYKIEIKIRTDCMN